MTTLINWFRITSIRIQLYRCEKVMACFGDDEWGTVARTQHRLRRELFELTTGRMA